MKRVFLFVLIALSISLAAAQNAAPVGTTVSSATLAVEVPRLVKVSGTIPNGQGTAGVTFLLYQNQTGGAPLWLETQNVSVDQVGHFTVYLGANSTSGLPAELFSSGEARWLGIQPEGQGEQARVLLVSVPYALKAADADTLGGRPASSYVTADQLNVGGIKAAGSASPTGSDAVAGVQSTATDVTTTGGTANYLPIFNGSTTIIDSDVYQTGTGSTAMIGIGTTAPVAPLDVEPAAQTGTSGTIYSTHLIGTFNPASASSAAYYGIDAQANTSSGNTENITGSLVGGGFAVQHFGTGTLSNIFGANYIVQNKAGGTVTSAVAVAATVNNTSTGTITTGYGVDVGTPQNSGVFTNFYGVYIANPSTVTNGWGLYSLAAKNYLSGDLGIGVTVPTQALEINGNIKLDTTGHGIYFPDGTLQTTAASGVSSVTATFPVTATPNTGAVTVGLTSTCSANQVLQYVGGKWTCSNVGTGSGTVTSITFNGGLTSSPDPITGTGTASIATGGVTDSMLQYDYVTLNAGAGLAGAGQMVLGGSAATIGIATGGVTDAMLQYDNFTINPGAGMTGGGSVPLGGGTTIGIATGGVTDAMLQYDYVTINPGAGMTGGGPVPLGSATTIGIESCPTGDVLESNGSGWSCAMPSGGVTPSSIQEEAYTYSADSGTANAYKVTQSPTPTVAAGSEVVFKAANTNTGPSTLSVNGGTATTIYKLNGTTGLASGDISAGQIVRVVYDGSYWQMQSPPAGPDVAITANGGLTATPNPITGTGTISIATGGVTDSMLQYDYVAVNPGAAMTGGGQVALGGSTTISLQSCSSANQVWEWNGSGWNCATIGGTGTVTSITFNGGLTSSPDPITSTGTASIATGGVTDSMLQYDYVTLSPGAGLTGGGTVALGNSTSLGIGTASVTNSMLQNVAMDLIAGNGLSGGGVVQLGNSTTFSINDGYGNTWSALQMFDGQIGTNGYSATGVPILGYLTSGGPSVWGDNTGSGNGVDGSSSSGAGVEGSSNSGYGVWGISSNSYAGYFSGNVEITGTLNGAAPSLKIDHPLDPANKYLYHSAVESSDMMNIYNGNTVLDANGEAWVALPDWFESLNRDFRYQLTPIGAAFTPYIAQEVTNNRFKISGGVPGKKVSWQVTGIRQDAFAKANPLTVEVEKSEAERGFYIHPELYGAPSEKSIEWALQPEAMKNKRDRHVERVQATQPLAPRP